MNIQNVNERFIEQALDLAWNNYTNECKVMPLISGCSKEDLSLGLTKAFQNGNGLMCLENDELVGYLAYNYLGDKDGVQWCNIPLWGYSATDNSKSKIISMLFQKLAENISSYKRIHFNVKLYAHDTEIIRLFSFLQFGIQCEEGVSSTDKLINHNSASQVRVLTKVEINDKWQEIWKMLKSLIEHLQKSPVFYPGTEFTEDVYKEYLTDASTQLIAAEVDGELAGIITANAEGNSFINNKAEFYNIGDVYVLPKYRGKMIAQDMLSYIFEELAKKEIHRAWVEHGTANPNARGFWNKYFDAYSYSMIRDIEIPN